MVRDISARLAAAIRLIGRGRLIFGGLCGFGRCVVHHSGEGDSGLKSVSSCTQGKEAKYEGYREAWHLLREASEICEASRRGEESAEVKSLASHPTGAFGAARDRYELLPALSGTRWRPAAQANEDV